jgi:hypothetical protein
MALESIGEDGERGVGVLGGTPPSLNSMATVSGRTMVEEFSIALSFLVSGL